MLLLHVINQKSWLINQKNHLIKKKSRDQSKNVDFFESNYIFIIKECKEH